MNREHIISEIQRTAKANGGVPLGRRRFERETGIGGHTWYGKHWTTWSDAVREAGFQPNEPLPAYEPSLLIEKLVALTRRLGRAPVGADLSFARNSDSTFPCKEVFVRRLGPKSERVAQVLAFCQRNAGYDDVAAIWTRAAFQLSSPPGYEGGPRLPSPPTGGRGQGEGGNAIGYVYLLKHGRRREYKIGRTRNPLRRVGELAFELPEESEPIHYIKTDDPTGIETYWHARFRTKCKRGEWFALTADDVRAFRRWKRIH
jgi:hypothetical protein